jgi:hypothetical protein
MKRFDVPIILKQALLSMGFSCSIAGTIPHFSKKRSTLAQFFHSEKKFCCIEDAVVTVASCIKQNKIRLCHEGKIVFSRLENAIFRRCFLGERKISSKGFCLFLIWRMINIDPYHRSHAERAENLLKSATSADWIR